MVKLICSWTERAQRQLLLLAPPTAKANTLHAAQNAVLDSAVQLTCW